MTTEELVRRVETLEASVLELRGRIDSKPAPQKRGILSMVGTMADRPEFSELEAKPDKKWWHREPIARTPEELEAFDEMTAYGKYYRLTGRDAPPDWKPGDPYPEPEYPE